MFLFIFSQFLHVAEIIRKLFIETVLSLFQRETLKTQQKIVASFDDHFGIYLNTKNPQFQIARFKYHIYKDYQDNYCIRTYSGVLPPLENSKEFSYQHHNKFLTKYKNFADFKKYIFKVFISINMDEADFGKIETDLQNL